jgi:rod shape-determining protein MreD
MIVFRYIIIIFVTFLFQSWTSEFFSLGTIDPDFCLIVLVYISIRNGGLVGTLFGFFIGLFIDLSSGTNQFFGVTPLVYTITGYFSAFLKGQNEKLNKLYFSSLWIFIIFCQFLIFSLIVYQQLLVEEPTQFLIKWLATSLYTLVFLGILQIMVPLYKL